MTYETLQSIVYLCGSIFLILASILLCMLIIIAIGFIISEVYNWLTKK